MIEFKEEVTAEQVEDVYNRWSSLKGLCVRSDSQKPYITKQMAGRNISLEKLTGGFTHIFIEEFKNEQDRNYYLKKDPAHRDFGKIVEPLVKSAQSVQNDDDIYFDNKSWYGSRCRTLSEPADADYF
ncbi:conserved hypothetical protein [Talaromyces stipitatus ATCC 10500]|uniref:Stress-response A/B barrel domain-containing protein n=1 Tax=Talaromyces stipitatus (strain ATCC 10500 / CBS 375.48 / QM 6759 / NRRL 1006) TaxID=441959 RepID=B8MAM2_TALSN|nr:uncharacterized protein TSTA_112780 [Talaromyces stipitatus ATCC 10500]EED17446.1 conserved hypothetical protein [Talaromyces stipitatus ATCC 10500]